MRDFEVGDDAWRLIRRKQWTAIKRALQWHRKCMGSTCLPNGRELRAFQGYWLTGQTLEHLPLAVRHSGLAGGRSVLRHLRCA